MDSVLSWVTPSAYVGDNSKSKDKKELEKLEALSEEELKDYYKNIGKGCWETVWEMLHSPGWKLSHGQDLETGIVSSKHIKEYGKIFKMEGYLDLSVEETFKLLVTDIEESIEWNGSLIEAKVLLQVADNMDIAYTATAAAAGGLIAARDFINYRHWETRGDITLSAGITVLHPAKPPHKSYVRAENKPGGWIFKKVPESPNRCHFMWIMNTDIKGWIPKNLIDRAYPRAQLDYLENTRAYINKLKK